MGCKVVRLLRPWLALAKEAKARWRSYQNTQLINVQPHNELLAPGLTILQQSKGLVDSIPLPRDFPNGLWLDQSCVKEQLHFTGSAFADLKHVLIDPACVGCLSQEYVNVEGFVTYHFLNLDGATRPP